MNIIQHDAERVDKERRCADIYRRIKECNINSPFNSHLYAKEYGIKESSVRCAIRELRLKGIRICSNPKQTGYWLEQNGGGYEQTRSQMLSRAYSLLEIVRAMDNCKDGQYEWGGSVSE